MGDNNAGPLDAASQPIPFAAPLPTPRAEALYRYKRKINSWTNIRTMHQNKLISSSYIWLILVPVIAKLLTAIENPLDFSSIAQGLKLNMALPFSWSIFYFAAISFSISNLIYRFFCPALISETDSFATFIKKGKNEVGLMQYANGLEVQRKLSGYLHNSEGFEEFIDESDTRLIANTDNLDKRIKTTYWIIVSALRFESPVARLLCITSISIGYLLVLWVIVENLLFVLKQV